MKRRRFRHEAKRTLSLSMCRKARFIAVGCLVFHAPQGALHCNQNKKQHRLVLFFVLVAEAGFEIHGLAKFSAENLASVTSRQKINGVPLYIIKPQGNARWRVVRYKGSDAAFDDIHRTSRGDDIPSLREPPKLDKLALGNPYCGLDSNQNRKTAPFGAVFCFGCGGRI